MKNILALLFAIQLSSFINFKLQAQETFGNDSVGNDFFRNKTKITNPFSLRDPFREQISSNKTAGDLNSGGLVDGVFTNLPSIDDLNLKDISIIGVLIGKDRRAIGQLQDGSTVILKEGMFLGKDNAEIKAILPGGMVLVEKIINVYGQEEFLETIVPIAEKEIPKSGPSEK